MNRLLPAGAPERAASDRIVGRGFLEVDDEDDVACRICSSVGVAFASDHEVVVGRGIKEYLPVIERKKAAFIAIEGKVVDIAEAQASDCAGDRRQRNVVRGIARELNGVRLPTGAKNAVKGAHDG
jgi:hypothetical protein